MNREHHKWYSPAMKHDMELLVFGHAGKPFLVFPCQEGSYRDYEGFGMVDVLSPWINEGKIQLICVDSVDGQSWCNQSIHPHDRAVRHNDFDWYLTHEVVPFIQKRLKDQGSEDRLITATGCSMGGYHSANYFFRHPELVDSMISISGLFRLNLFIGDYMDSDVYYNTPLVNLPQLTDHRVLELYRNSQIFAVCGQGAWEDDMLADIKDFKWVTDLKGIPAFIEVWGHDVNHDWVWWHRMMPYLMDKLDLHKVRPKELATV